MPSACGGRGDALAQLGRDRVSQRHVRDEARAEEARLAREGAIDELIDEHEKAGIEFAAEGPACGHRDDVRDARPLQGVDIGAIVD